MLLYVGLFVLYLCILFCGFLVSDYCVYVVCGFLLRLGFFPGFVGLCWFVLTCGLRCISG